jgi:hypothetical protein
MEKKEKEDLDKFKHDKDELTKTLNRVTMKESQFKHELKKKDLDYEELKNKLKKTFNQNNLNNEKENTKNSTSLNSSTINITTHNNNYNTIQSATHKLDTLLSCGGTNTPHNRNNSNNNYQPEMVMSSPININTNVNNGNEIIIGTHSNNFNFIDNVKNSPTNMYNIKSLKEFYNLIFQAFDEKMKYVLAENQDLRDCYKLILREIKQFVSFKKELLSKFSKDFINDDIKNKMSQFDNLLNENIFELDFNDSRDMILTNYNDILNIFRFILLYDLMKIDPSEEFNYDELRREISNKKYEVVDVPYYYSIKTNLENINKLEKFMDFAKDNKIKLNNNNNNNIINNANISFDNTNNINSNTNNNNNNNNNTLRKKSSVRKDDIFIINNNNNEVNTGRNLTAKFNDDIIINNNSGSNIYINDNNVNVTNISCNQDLDQINKELLDTINYMEEKFDRLENVLITK